jgi:ferredoxin
MSLRLKVDMIACDGHGVCAELVPEMVGLDEWGYPIVDSTPLPENLMKHARRAVRLCPKLALTVAQDS